MKTKHIDEILLEHPFFEGMNSDFVRVIAGCGINKLFHAEELLAREGKTADFFYLVRQGRLAIEMHTAGRGHLILQTQSDGDIVGWSWLFPPHLWNFDVRAMETSHVIALDGKCLRQKCEIDKALGYDLMKRFSQIMVERLRAVQVQVMDLYGNGR